MRYNQRRNWVRIILIWLFVALLVCSGAGLAYAKVQSTVVVLEPQTMYHDTSVKNTAELAWPDTGQASVAVVGYGVLESHGTQKPAAIASVAKLITALCVLEKKPLKLGETGPYLTIGPADVALYHSYVAQGGSVVPVNNGEQLSEYDALEALLLPSANNIADSLAIWAFGSLSAYTTYANNWLKQHGLTQTTVGTDASGLADSSTGTSRDIAEIGILAHNHLVVAEIAAKSTAEIPVAGTIKNVNWLLGVDGINGLKTGNSDAAGGAFVFSATIALSSTKSATIVGSVLQAPTLSAAMQRSRTLVQSATKSLTYQSAVSANTVVGQYHLPNPNIVSTAHTKTAVSAMYWRGALLDKPHLKLQSIAVPRSAESTVGTISFGADSTQSTKVVLSDDLPQASWWYRLWH